MSQDLSALAAHADQVLAILARQALRDPAELAPDMTFEALGLDSLGLVEAIFAIEEHFDISLPFNPQQPGGQTDLDSLCLGDLIAEVARQKG